MTRSRRLIKLMRELDKIGQVLESARNLIDLELSEEIPVSIRPEWDDLARDLNALMRGEEK